MKMKKWIPFLLTLTMVFGTLPVGVYAEGEDNVTQEISGIETSDEPDAGSTKITVNGQTFENSAEEDANTISESFTQTETDNATEVNEQTGTNDEATVDDATETVGKSAAVATMSASDDVVAGIAAVVDSGDCGDDATWTYDDNTYTLTISGIGAMADYEDNTYAPWFLYQNEIQTVVIEEGVTTIGDWALNIGTLENITLPSTLKSIGAYAFLSADRLTSISIPSGVESIGDFAFLWCTDLSEIKVDSDNAYYTTVDGVLMNEAETELICYPVGQTATSYSIPAGVEVIGDYAFCWSNNLESINIPSSVITIQLNEEHWLYAFYDCSALTEITVDSDNQYFTVVDGVLMNKAETELICYPSGKTATSYSIPYGVESIGDIAFAYGLALDNIEIASSVKSIGSIAFAGCENLNNIEIPSSVTSIGLAAFECCHSLESVTILSTTVEIGDGVFYDCAETLTIYGYSGSAADTYAEEERITFSPLLLNEITWVYDAGTQTLTISGTGAMDNYEYLDDYVGTNIPWIAHQNEVKYVVIEEGVTSIGDFAFCEFLYIESVSIPSSITSIGEYAFCDCMYLESVIIPEGVESIGDYAFVNCADDFTIYGYTGSTAETYAYDNEITFVALPEVNEVTWSYEPSTYTLTISGTGAMDDYEYSFGAPWYSHQSEIKYVVIEEGVTSIGDWAFALCTYMESVTIPSGIVSIGDRAFYGCEALQSITIPASVKSVGEDIFWYSYALEGIYVDSENTSYCDVDGVLFNIEQTELLAYPAGKTNTTYIIPDTVTSIADYAFCGGEILTTVTIPSSVKSIGQSALAASYNLSTVIVYSTTMDIADSVFYGCEGLIIYGYTGSTVEAYATTNDITFVALDSDAIDLGTVVQYINFSFDLFEYIEVDTGHDVDYITIISNGDEENIWYDSSYVGGVATNSGTVFFVMNCTTTGETSEATYIFSLEVEAVTESHEDELTDVGYEVTTPLPDVIDLDNAQDYTFVSQGPFSEFQGVKMNGETLILDTDYTAVEGSTKITIKAQTFENNTVEGNNVIVASFLQAETNEEKYAVQVFTTEETTTNTGGSSSGGGSSSSSSSDDDDDDESIVEFTTADNELVFETEVDVEIVDGKAMVSIDLDMLQDILDEMADAEGDVPMQLLITLPELDESVQSANVSLPMDLLAAIADLENTSLAIDMQHIGLIEFGDAALDAILEKGGEEFAFDLSRDPITEILLYIDGEIAYDIEFKIALPNMTNGDVVQFTQLDETKLIKKSAMTSDCAYALLVGSGVIDAMYNARTFDDIQDNSSITAMSARGLFMGTGDNQFTANGSMTRGMIASVLHRLEDNEATTGVGSFADVAVGEWYEAGVNWAAEKGIVVGYGDGIFGATDEITVEQIIVFLYRYADYSDMNTTQRGDVTSFGDTSAWSTEQIKWAVATGILTDSNTQPQDVATRAQGTELFDRFIGLMVK